MKRLAKTLALLAAAYLILVGGSGLAIKMVLSKGRINGLVAALNERVPVKLSVEDGSFDLTEWLRFRPVVALRGISVANPAGFAARPMLTVKEAGAQVALLSLFGGGVRVIRAHLIEPVVNIVTDAKGRTNVMALAAALSQAGGPEENTTTSEGGGASGTPVSVDQVTITGGTLRYQGQGGETLTVRDVDLSLANFGAGRTTEVTLGARLFGGKTSRLEFKGAAGPVTESSAPAKGSLTVLIRPAEIPKKTRDLYLGQMLADPPEAASLALSARLEGDALKTLAGTGELEFADFALGGAAGRLPLKGKAPFRLAVENALGMPAVDLRATGAALQLGGGRWNGTLAARIERGEVTGESAGSVAGVRIEEMLGAFTTAKNSVSGVAELPRYQVRFRGRDAAAIRNSLAGEGSVQVRDGKVSLFDLVGTVEEKIRGILGGESGKKGDTNFVTLQAGFTIKNSQMQVAGLSLTDSNSSVTGQGIIGFDHTLGFDLTADITGGTVAKLVGRGGAGGGRLRVPVKVRGTLESPKVYPDVAGLAKAQVVDRAKGLLDGFLNRKKSGGEAK